MLIYHGSDHIIEKPIHGYGKKYNDYGVGFYCTDSFDMAREWAVDLNRDGYANTYLFEDRNLSILNLTSDEYSVLHWIAILLDNRNFEVNTSIAAEAKRYLLEHFLPDYDRYDVICGYRADDSYFAYARDFINNALSVEKLGQAMRFGNLGEQIVLKSEKAFGNITFSEAIIASANVWYPRKNMRDMEARKRYRDLDKKAFKKGETYVLKIIEEEISDSDPRLR